MITMISFARTEALENQAALAGENDENDLQNPDFAAAFSSVAGTDLLNNSTVAAQASPSPNADNKSGEAHLTSANWNGSPPVITKTEMENAAQDFGTSESKTGKSKPEISNFKSIFGLPPNDDKSESVVRRDEKNASENTREVIKTYLETGAAEVVKEASVSRTFQFSQNDFFEVSTAHSSKGEAASLPQIFKEISGVLKNEKTVQTEKSDSIPGAVSENKIFSENNDIALLKTDAGKNENAFDLNRRQIEMPEDKSQNKPAPENLSSAAFDQVLSASATEGETVEIAANIKAEKVFEQIEPKMMRILTLENVENEKKILKMRLHPAELGTVEIRLEKDAATGRLNAHFQTESETTKQILTQSLDQLRDSLQNSGWQIERLEISCNPFSSSAQGGARENASQGQFERIGNKSKRISDDSSTTDEDDGDNSKSIEQNRLLSVRA